MPIEINCRQRSLGGNLFFRAQLIQNSARIYPGASATNRERQMDRSLLNK